MSKGLSLADKARIAAGNIKSNSAVTSKVSVSSVYRFLTFLSFYIIYYK